MQQGKVQPFGQTGWQDALIWWNKRRLAYNVVLVAAGIVAFGFYVLAFERWAPRNDPDVEITAYTILFQGMGYLVCIVAANIAFFLGPTVEQVIQKRWVDIYRRLAFGAGVAGSAILPMLAPAVFFLEYGFGR